MTALERVLWLGLTAIAVVAFLVIGLGLLQIAVRLAVIGRVLKQGYIPPPEVWGWEDDDQRGQG